MKKLLLLLIIPLLFSCNENSMVEERLETKKEVKKKEEIQNQIEKIEYKKTATDIYKNDTINPTFEKILSEEYGLAKENEIIFKVE